jgi:hypothetical protein
MIKILEKNHLGSEQDPELYPKPYKKSKNGSEELIPDPQHCLKS